MLALQVLAMSTTDRPVIKAPEETIKYLQSDERERFFSAVKKQKKPAKRARDLALFELMYLYGLRPQRSLCSDSTS